MIHHLLPATEARREVIRLLSALGFDEPETAAGQYPHEFSGGMRERILIALALICNPRLIIADEPTSGLDAQVKSQILHLIKKQIADNRTLFLITHDMGTASFLCARIAVMYAGEIVETGLTKEVLAMPMHPYTQGLLASLPSAGLHPIPRYEPGTGTSSRLDAGSVPGARRQRPVQHVASPLKDDRKVHARSGVSIMIELDAITKVYTKGFPSPGEDDRQSTMFPSPLKKASRSGLSERAGAGRPRSGGSRSV